MSIATTHRAESQLGRHLQPGQDHLEDRNPVLQLVPRSPCSADHSHRPY